MPHDLSRIAARLFNVPLAVQPDVAETIAANLSARFAGGAVKPKAFDDDGDDVLFSPDDDAAPYRVVDGVATIAVRGELINRGSWIDAASGLTSYENLQGALRQAEGDGSVRGILLDMDSPGGEAAGAMETAAVTRAVANVKPIVAFVNSKAASAAYAIAAAASEIVVAPSSIVGSIGVICLHMDYSKAFAEAGLKPTLIRAGAFKADGNPYEPLADPARARIQAMIDDTYGLFVDSVGAHRPKLGAKGARATEAGVFMGAAAVESGLADRVGDLGLAMKRLTSRSFFHRGTLDMTEITQAQLDAAVASAVAATRAELTAAQTSAVTAAAAAAETAARARIDAILNCDAAKGREPQASHLAMKTTIAADEAIAILAAAPAAAPPTGGRMANVPKPPVKPDGRPADPADASAEADAEWTRITANLNRSAGLAAKA